MRKFPFRLAHGTGKELTVAGVLFALALAASVIWPRFYTLLPAVLLAVLFGFLLLFFRDPVRTPPQDDSLVLAPADGEIMAVEMVDEPRFLIHRALKISIFMSLLNVHVNRAPVAGRVALVQHVPGQFLQAFRPESSALNEHNLIGLETTHGRVLVKQVAGILARRIVCTVEVGQELATGQRVGLIKFGSRVELFLPPEAEPAVQPGDRTHAGLTVIARWKGDER